MLMQSFFNEIKQINTLNRIVIKCEVMDDLTKEELKEVQSFVSYNYFREIDIGVSIFGEYDEKYSWYS